MTSSDTSRDGFPWNLEGLLYFPCFSSPVVTEQSGGRAPISHVGGYPDFYHTDRDGQIQFFRVPQHLASTLLCSVRETGKRDKYILGTPGPSCCWVLSSSELNRDNEPLRLGQEQPWSGKVPAWLERWYFVKRCALMIRSLEPSRSTQLRL